MTFIISPWIFYLIQIANSLTVIVEILLFCECTVAIIMFCGYCVCSGAYDEESAEICKNIKEKTKRLFIPLFIFTIALEIFIPSQETCYQMLIASCATEENIEKVGESAEGFVDYIIESVKELQESES